MHVPALRARLVVGVGWMTGLAEIPGPSSRADEVRFPFAYYSVSYA